MNKLLILIAILAASALSFLSDKQRIFMIGDSTMATKNPGNEPETGWGQVFPSLFSDAVEIQNHAVNGRSTRSFRALGHWKKVEDQLQKGDYVFIQFGHNDQKIADTSRYAEADTDYRLNLERYINETQAKGAIPVLFTPVMRRKFDADGKFVDQHGDYPKVVKEVAAKHKLALIDLTALSLKVIEQHGAEGSKKIFMHYQGGVYPRFPNGVEDNTHFSPYGAHIMAKLVADELVRQKHPLKKFLKES